MGKEMNVIPLRPHHGMCLAFYKGKGYSDGFTAHMQEMLALLEPNADVRLVVETDEICSACPNNVGGICEEGHKVACYDRNVLDRCEISEGEVLSFREFAGQVQKKILSADGRREICGDCQWNELCENTASRWS